MEFSRNDVIKWWSMIRWFMLVVLFAVGMLHISSSLQILPTLVFIGVFFGIMVLNLLFQINAKMMGNVTTAFQIVLDVIFATMVVHITGGESSYFVWVYLMGVITASLMVPQVGGLITGLISSASLFCLIMLYQYNIVIPLNMAQHTISDRIIYILSYTALFCGVAMIANYISDQLEHSAQVINEVSNRLDRVNSEWEKDKKLLQTKDKQLLQSQELVKTAAEIAHLDHDLNTPLCVISLSIGRVKRLGMEKNDDNLLKTSNEITEAINKINHILLRLVKLKTHPLIRDYKEGLTHEQKNFSS